MTTQLVPFFFETHEIRAVVVDGIPLFGSRDIALALGYADPSYAYKTHCKYLKLLSSLESSELGWVNPNPRGEYVMPESDVYRLIIRSNKPEAERFEKWVFEEVLPTIRKVGSYAVPNNALNPTDHQLAAAALSLVPAAIAAAKAFGFSENHAILSADRFIKTATTISVLAYMGDTKLIADHRGQTYIPTDLGQLMTPVQSARRVNQQLRFHGLQNQDAVGNWFPTEKAAGLFEWIDTGKRHSDGSPVKQLRWFQTVIAILNDPESKAA